MKKIMLIVVSLFVILGCTNTNKNNQFTIGAILPLTGERALMGELGKNGLLLAENYLNDSVFKEKKIKLVIEDGSGVPTKSLNSLNKLLSLDKANIIFSIVSGVDFAILPIQSKQKFLFISHTTHPALSGVNNLVFRHSPTINQELSLISHFSKDKNNALIFMNDEYSVPLRDSLVNMNIVKKEHCISFDKSTTEFTEISLLGIKNNPQIIIISGTGSILADLVNKLRDIGYKGEIMTTLGFSVTGALKSVKNKEGLSTINFSEIEISDNFSSLVSEFQKKEGRNITQAEIIFFNSLYIVGIAIKDGAGNIEEIASNIKNMENFHGLGENITVNKLNDIEPTLQIIKY